MLKGAIGKVMWVGRATVFLVGLAVILALVFGAASVALGANGKPFLLGKGNVASAISTLTNRGQGPALRLNVQAGEPPLAVDSDERVNGLNADELDGKDFAALDATRVIGIQGPLPREGTFTSEGGTLILSASGSGFRGTGQSLTNGRIGMRILLDGREVGFSSIFANQRNTHMTFISDYRVIEDMPAGEHTVRLEAVYFDNNCNQSGQEDQFDYCTTTDAEDFFKVLVMEIPD